MLEIRRGGVDACPSCISQMTIVGLDGACITCIALIPAKRERKDWDVGYGIGYYFCWFFCQCLDQVFWLIWGWILVGFLVLFWWIWWKVYVIYPALELKRALTMWEKMGYDRWLWLSNQDCGCWIGSCSC